MIYLLWSLLDIGLFLYFIIICFRATNLIRGKLGLLASIIFVFGLLSFIGHTDNHNRNKESNSSQTKTWKFASQDSFTTKGSYLLLVDLQKT